MSKILETKQKGQIHPIVNRVGGVFMHVSNMERSVNWYHKLFGLPERSSMTDKVHALAMDGGSGLVLDQHGYDRGLVMKDRPLLMLDSPNVQKAYQTVKELGIPIEWEIEEYPGMAFFTFRDPDGNLLMVCGDPGSKSENVDKDSVVQDLNQQIRYDAGGTWLITNHNTYHSLETDQGLELTGRAYTEAKFATPLKIETTVRIEEGCLKLEYGLHGVLTFNYGPSANNGAGEEFYVTHPKVNKQFSYLNKGAIPVGEWVNVDWTIHERSMQVHVNGKIFHVQEGYFGDMIYKAGIGGDNGRITVKSFTVESLQEHEMLPQLPITCNHMQIDVLEPDASCYPILTSDGLWLTYNELWGTARTNKIYSTPFTMEVIVRSDTNSLVLYGGSSTRVKFHSDSSLSFLDPISKEEIWVEQKGLLTKDFTTVTWQMDENHTSVAVDGNVRFEKEGNYRDCRFILGIGADLGNAVVVKSVQIQQ
jgi:predicted enzyme related to lactoylglutathione lyase